MKPKIAILQTDGTNCDEELFFAFAQAGGAPEMVHINELLSKKKQLSQYQILGLPGGFSYGDDILSGKILANELRSRLSEEMDEFIRSKKLVLGICNGFQTLVRGGYLPWRMKPAQDVSLIFNTSGHFECRWVKVQVQKSACIFTRGLEGQVFDMPVAHGEGKLVIRNNEVGSRLMRGHHSVFRYACESGNVTMSYPDNPNGSWRSIAGLTDETGHILGLMPHPERNTLFHHIPTWRSRKADTCLSIFSNAVSYFT